MKLAKRDIEYASLNPHSPLSPPRHARMATIPLVSPTATSSSAIMDSMDEDALPSARSSTSSFFEGESRTPSTLNDVRVVGSSSSSSSMRHDEYPSSAVRDLVQALEIPIKRFTFEIKGALLAAGIAAMCYLLSWFKAVLVPFFLAVFLMYLVDPLVELIDVSPKYFLCICTQRGRHKRRKSRGCSRAFASLCAVAIVCFFFGLLGYITMYSIHGVDVNAYQQGYNDLVSGAENLLAHIGLPFNITTTLHDNVDMLARMVFTQTMDFFSMLFVTIIYLTYFLCTRTRASDAGGVWSKIDHDIQRFVTLKCFLSLFVALLVTIVYVSLNVGLAIVWGILTFILNWIPNVGAMCASVLPIAIIAITPGTIMNPMEKILAIALPMCLHMFVGNFIEPKVFGRKLEMDPVVVILSLSAWGLLWGVVGMMLSVPLTAGIKIALSHLKILTDFVALLEGTYFTRYQAKNAFKKNEQADFQTMEVRSDMHNDAIEGMRP